MCGRYTLYHDEEDLTSLFELESFPLTRRYNVAPTQTAPFVRQQGGVRERLDGRWGLIPHWVRDPATFRTLLFNARSESAAEKPSFRDAFRSARCVVPASGFFEWAKRDGSKAPHHVVRSDGAPMLLAGLYSVHREAGPTFTILTTRPNGPLSALHDRMPVILERDALPRWLSDDVQDAADLLDLLAPAPDEVVTPYGVGRAVGNVRLDDPSLIQPA